MLIPDSKRTHRLVKADHRLRETLVLVSQMTADSLHRVAPAVKGVFYAVEENEVMVTPRARADASSRY